MDVLATAQLPGEVMLTVALPPLVKTLLPADTVIVPPLPKALLLALVVAVKVNKVG